MLLPITGVSLCGFIFYYGNHQFGGFDHSMLIDVGWRMAGGQSPYTDFICTLPPGFLLGAKYAFQLFGVTWDSQLYFAGAYSAAAFLWLYFLFARLLESRAAAYFSALCITCAASLSVDYWWFHPITSTAAAIFFLSCLWYVAGPGEWKAQLSLGASLFLLGLMKPNTAGLLIAACLGILFTFGPRRNRLAVLAAGALAAALAFLKVNGISVVAMLRSYMAAAENRGRVGQLVGFLWLHWPEKLIIVGCAAALLLPPTIVWARSRHGIPATLLLVSGPVVAALATVTDFELNYVQTPLLVCSGAILIFGRGSRSSSFDRRVYAAILCSLAAISIFAGVVRYRVHLIGEGAFFEWDGADRVTDTKFFAHLRCGPHLVAVLRQVEEIRAKEEAPFFFGPRMEFEYAVQRLPSPERIPFVWDPGTEFRFIEESAILEKWKEHRFRTLVFLKDDFTHYTPAFLGLLGDMYVPDQHYSELTILRLK
jgi:hypothetical protein